MQCSRLELEIETWLSSLLAFNIRLYTQDQSNAGYWTQSVEQMPDRTQKQARHHHSLRKVITPAAIIFPDSKQTLI